MREPTKDDMPETFPEWRRHYITMANWQYVLLGVSMFMLGSVLGFVIGYHAK